MQTASKFVWRPTRQFQKVHAYHHLIVIEKSTKRQIWSLNAVMKRNMGYWPRSRWLDIAQVLFFACLWTEKNKHAKKRTRPMSSHLDRTSLVNKGFIIWDKTPKQDKFSLRDKARIPSRQDSSNLHARIANQSARFGWSCPITELVL